MFIKFLALVLSALMAITSIPVTSEMPEKTTDVPITAVEQLEDTQDNSNDAEESSVSGEALSENASSDKEFEVSEQAAYSGTCGENLTWTFDTETGVLDITGSGDMTNWTSSSSVPWYSYRSSVKTVNIGNSVISIGSYAFYYCKSLTSITIPDSVTSIGKFAFYYCDSLTSVTIGNSVTSIGDSAFYGTGYYNENSNWTDGVLYISNHLIKAKNTISGDYIIEQGTKTIAAFAFEYCDSLTSVTIGNSVTSIGDSAFYDCDNLTSITIPDSVTSIGSSAFYSCDELTSITIPDSVTSIENYAFYETGYYNENSNWTNGVLYISNRLIEAKNTISGDYIIKQGTKTIADSAFYNCDSLTSVTIGNSVTSIGSYAFAYCDSLTSVTVAEDNPNYSSDEYGVLFNKDKTVLIQYPIGNTRTEYTISDSVTSIRESAFYSCNELTSVTIGNSVTSIGEEAFSWCRKLTSVTIGNSVTSIGKEAFSVCDSLTSIIISDSVTSIGEEAFSSCDELTSVTIGNSVASIGVSAFEWCYDLTDITIPASVISIGENAFRGCSDLTSITVEENSSNYSSDEYGVLFNKDKSLIIKYPAGNTRALYTIPDTVTSIGDYAFYSCDSLISVTIPDSVTSIEQWAFDNCDSLISVTIPDSVTNLEKDAFYHCGKLTRIIIGNSVESLELLTFAHCDNLISVTIPTSVTIIDTQVFYGCDSLTDVYYNGTQEDWNEISISSGNTPLTNATIHYNHTHSYTETVISEPTCEESGIKTYTCVHGESYEEITPALGHNYQNSTCVNCGKVLYSGNCGENLTWTLDTETGVFDITGSGAMTNWTSSTDVPWYSYRTNIRTVNVGNSVTSIGSYAFSNCDSLTSVTIGNSVTSIGDNAFSWCDSLTSITIPDSVTSIGDYAFSWCDSFKSITIPDSVTSIGDYAFFSCNGLTSVTIGNSVTVIGYCAFAACDRLINIIVVNENSNYSSDEHGVLFNKDKTLLIQYLKGNTRTEYTIPDSVTSIGDRAFYWCDSLTSVTIGNSVISIGDNVFDTCDNLTSVTIPDSVTSIGDYAFRGCDRLTSITVAEDNPNYSSDEYGVLFNKDKTVLIQYPKGNTRTAYTIPDSVTSIGDWAFYNCDGLTSVTIGNSVTSIEYAAFYICYSLTDVYFGGTEDAWNKISIDSYNTPLTNATIHYNHLHSYTETVTKESTCTDTGVKTFSCECGDSYTEEILALGHDYQNGICSRCDEEDSTPADYTAVEAAKAKVPADLTIYVNGDAVTAAVEAIVYGLNITKQAEVDAMAQAIEDAIAALELKAADYTAVEAAKAKVPVDLSIYTNGDAVTAAVAAVVYGLNVAKQAEVDAYAQAIEAAVAGLELKKADYTAVELAKAKVPADLSIYANGDAVTAAVAAVVYGLDITEQAEVDAMAKAIEDAIAALELKAADYTAVEEAITKIPADLTIYTDETVAELNAAVVAVVYGLDITKQAEVDAYAQAIEAAVVTLELKGADYTAVEEAIAKIPADLTVYTDETVAELNAAVEAVVYGLDITKQAEVNAYAAAIEAAISGLEPKKNSENPQYEISKEKGRAGEEVEVYISIKNNPGIISLRNSISYDTTALELVGVENLGLLNGYTNPSATISSPYILRWADSLALENNTSDGEFVKLTFKIKENTEVGDYEISVNPIESRNFNGEKITFESVTTTIKVIEYIVGDVDNDGEITDWDEVVLGRYLAGWNVNIEILEAADVNRDGEVSDWDAILLVRYLSGWDVVLEK